MSAFESLTRIIEAQRHDSQENHVPCKINLPSPGILSSRLGMGNEKLLHRTGSNCIIAVICNKMQMPDSKFRKQAKKALKALF